QGSGGGCELWLERWSAPSRPSRQPAEARRLPRLAGAFSSFISSDSTRKTLAPLQSLLRVRLVSSPVPGSRFLVAGCWLLVAGCWLLVAGCWLAVHGFARHQPVSLVNIFS